MRARITKFPQVLWAELLHHFHVSTLCTSTPGSGELLMAALDMSIPCAAFCKNAAHVAYLEKRLEAYLCTLTADNQSTHYISSLAS